MAVMMIQTTGKRPNNMPFRVAITAIWTGMPQTRMANKTAARVGEKGGVLPLGAPDAQHI